MTEVYNPKTFIPHAASHRQAFAHCERFSTAASRRSLGSVSVPVWLTILSDQLPVKSLGGPLPRQQADRTWAPLQAIGLAVPIFLPQLHAEPWSYPVLALLSECYPEPEGRLPTYSSPFCRYQIKSLGLAASKLNKIARLACLNHAANVRSEPESNSPKKLT